MLLIYYNIQDDKTYSYFCEFDITRVLGESNKFGDVLVGLYVWDDLEHRVIPYPNGSIALHNTWLRYQKNKKREEVS